MKFPRINISDIDLSKIELPRIEGVQAIPHVCWQCRHSTYRGKAYEYDKCDDKFIKQGWCITYKW